MDKTSRLWVGADPGGKGAFGLAFVDASGAVRCETVSSVDEAVNTVTAMGKPLGLGIDAPMWWSAAEGGRRRADARLRKRYGISSGTVQSGNSLRGAALIGGALLASRLREAFPSLRITESHPKALLLALESRRNAVRPPALPSRRAVATSTSATPPSPRCVPGRASRAAGPPTWPKTAVAASRIRAPTGSRPWRTSGPKPRSAIKGQAPGGPQSASHLAALPCRGA